MKQLTSIEQFHNLLKSEIEFLIFKHSSRCSISGGACREVYQAIEKLGLKDIYLLDVLKTGNLKYELADEINIKHESPQIIIFDKGKLRAHASHGTISQGWITNKLKGWHDTRSKE